MTTYNTGNPVPSADARDRYDNSQTFDEVINGTLTFYRSRVGSNIMSLAGMQSLFNASQIARSASFNAAQDQRKNAFQDFIEGSGWVSLGAYAAGVIITSHTQSVDYLGQPYQLKPSIPVSLDNPYTAIGDWTTESVNFKLVGDNALRQDLSSPEGSEEVGHTDGGLPLSVSERLTETPAAASSPVQACLMAPVLGFDNGATDTSIFPGASNAFQGLSIIEVAGVPTVFTIQRVAGSEWTVAERCRITATPLVTDGSSVPVTVFSQAFNAGHGTDLTAMIEGGEVYLYTSQKVDTFTGALAGKGYSRIRWRGAATSQADVESFAIWGQPGSKHPFELYNRATVAISDDGRYLIMAAGSIAKGYGRRFCVYDWAEVQAIPGADKTSAVPLYTWALNDVKDQGGNTVQGLCSDGHVIKIVMGGTDVFGQNFIVEYNVSGTLLRNIPVDGPAARYGGRAGIMNNPLGIPWRFEPEGICNWRGGSVYTVAEGWFASGQVVTLEGMNFGCISRSSISGVPPTNRGVWTNVSLPATDGAYSDTASYINTAPLSNASKYLYYVGSSLGLAQEEPISSGIMDIMDPSAVPTGQGGGATSIGGQHRSSFNVRMWSPVLNRFYNALEYDKSSRLNIYDQRFGNDNSMSVSVQATFSPEEHAMTLRAKGTTAASSPTIKMNADTCPSGFAHHLREFTGPLGSTRRDTDPNGQTSFSCSSTFVPLRAVRPDSGYGIKLARGTVDIGGLSQNTTSLAMQGEDGILLRFATTVGGAQSNLWEFTPSAILRPSTGGIGQIGQASAMPQEIFAKTGTINTCDARLKTELWALKAAELAVGRRLVREIGVWQWLSDVERKGDNVARWHLSPTVQKAIEIFEEEGLDPLRYGMICHDEWDAEYETVDAVLELIAPDDESGEEQYREVSPAHQKLVREAGDLYSFREGQTHALMLAAMAADRDADKLENDQRFSEMKGRIEALEKLNS